MTGHNAPLTPPLTENDIQQLLASQSPSSANPPTTLRHGHASAVFQDVFPAISNFAIQNLLPELISLAEATELSADAASRQDETRLLVVGPLVLSYIITDELPPALFALRRLPENLASHPLSKALLKLLAATQNRTYHLVYKNANDLVLLVQGDLFDSLLATVVKLLVERHITAFRRKTAELLLKAYTSLPLPLAMTYLNLPEDGIRRAMESYGWMYDSTVNQLIAPSSRNPSSHSNLTSTQSTIRLIVGGAAQFDIGS
ncbi:uncharacterized protein FOMMEDRAFT_157414 [Fomitiporia mediterranea MF3/22]|uniref:uncharacterized protein n=1 Tax=Fomitiporia mediterranea (strain MF3/22) TaxID=694068 RepID=UPI0004409048|nr:uncharacterized protein FOMMEDRAFT_157414 [Fomitiporia mediterranea MF3/22]EJD02203.1 hypothetical protein FOMMEDRAFT_157414 [Fomitiporia mediterranea MF3/22]